MTDNCVVDIKTQNRQHRGYTLFLLLLVFIASHVDRQIVAILQEPIRIAFDLTDTQLGILTGFAFALFYATLGMPMAMWADRRNRRNLIAFSISLWSAMTVACAAAGQYWQLLAARIGVAVGEAGSNPPSHSIIADLYEPAERATAMAIFGLGVNFGIMFGFLIGGWVNDWVGWRWAFVIAGAPGLLIALAVRFTMQEPPRGLSDGLTSEIQPPPFFLVVRTMWRGQPNSTTSVEQLSDFDGRLCRYRLGTSLFSTHSRVQHERVGHFPGLRYRFGRRPRHIPGRCAGR